MTPDDRVARAIPDLLAQLVEPAPYDDLDLLLTRTAASRQRPAWSFLERWIPMSALARSVRSVPPVPWRLAGVVALLLLALAAVYLVGAGGPRVLPEPFGPASNGLIVVQRDGRIVTVDPRDGREVASVADEAAGRRPIFSGDGSRVAYARRAGGAEHLVVAPADLRSTTVVTPEPLSGLSAWSFSPDGRSLVALAMVEGDTRMVLLSADGSDPMRVLPGAATLDDSPPQFRPPDGGAILYLEELPTGRAIAILDLATETTRILKPPSATLDIPSVSWSPDGTRVAYAGHDPSREGLTVRSYIIDADGTNERPLDVGGEFHVPSIWSNDGTRLLIGRFDATSTHIGTEIVPVDDPASAVAVTCPPSFEAEGCAVDLTTWSPDDRTLLGRVVDRDTGQALASVTVDAATGRSTVVPWEVTGDPSWQRVAAP